MARSRNRLHASSRKLSEPITACAACRVSFSHPTLAFRNSEALRRFTTLNKTMKRTIVLLFLLLAAVLSFGRTVSDSDEDTAQAVKGALLLRDSMRDPDSLVVSRALIAKKVVCIEYQRRNRLSTGFAAYKTNQNLIFIDNSWVWEHACLVGKFQRLRDGKDVTEAVNAALKERHAPAVQSVAPAAAVAQAPAAQPVAPAVRVRTPPLTAHAPVAAVAPGPVAQAPAPQPVVSVAPVVTPVPVAPASTEQPTSAALKARQVPTPVAAPAAQAVQTPAATPVSAAPAAQAVQAPVVTPVSTAPAAQAVQAPVVTPVSTTPAAPRVCVTLILEKSGKETCIRYAK